MSNFWTGVVTTIVCGVFALFFLWFLVSATVGNPRVVECVKDNTAGAVSYEVESSRKHGYIREFYAGDCTVYFHASNKDKYFR